MEDLPDIVGSTEDHSGFSVARDADVGEAGPATGALEASVVPKTIERVKEETLQDLATASGAGSDSLAVAALLLLLAHHWTTATASHHIAAVHVHAHVLLRLLLHHVLLLHAACTHLRLLLLLLLLRRHLHVHHAVHRTRPERHRRAVHHIISHHLTAGHVRIAAHHRPLLLAFHGWPLEHGIGSSRLLLLLLLLLLHSAKPIHAVDRSARTVRLLLGR